MIELDSVSVAYGSKEVVHDLSLSIGRGDFVLLTGPSGCGKSTLIRLLVGLMPEVVPARVAGKASVGGLDPVAETPAAMSKKVGAVFQNPASQLFCLSVEEEVAFGPHNLAMDESEVRERVEWALEVTGLAELRDRVPSELSGGQKQLVAIASALAMKPEILVLDEPFASLDVPGLRRVLETLISLNREHGVTILLVEHRLVEAARVADRIVVMNEGAIVADGEPARVLEDRSLLRRLGIRRPTDEPPGNWVDLLSPNGSDPGVPPLVEAERLVAGYGRRSVLRGVDLRIYPGEFVALVGRNGVGKSTLARALAGLIKPKSGTVRFMGKKVSPSPEIGILFQNPLDQVLTDSVMDEVSFGPLHWGRFDRSRIEELMEAADLSVIRDRSPYALSSGQQQRTTLAATISTNPRFLILDEPTLGQDWGHLERVMEFVKRLNRSGSTVLLITHDYKLAHRYVDRVLLMEDGRIVADGRISDRGRSFAFDAETQEVRS